MSFHALFVTLYVAAFSYDTVCGVPQPGALSNTPLLHLHVPKTAGTALAVYMQNNWSRRCAEARLNSDMFGTPLQGTPENGVFVTDVNAPCYWVTVHAGPEGHGWPLMSILTQRHGAKFRYAHGHIGFGSCDLLERNCQYTTLLREPYDRMLSHYFYLREAHPGIHMIACEGCDTFKGFLQSLIDQRSHMYGSDNFYTRMLSGDTFTSITTQNVVCTRQLDSCDIIPFLKVNETHLKTAKENLLNRFPVIGILEEIQTYQALMLYHYDYLPYPMETLRKTQSRLQVSDLDEETIQMLNTLLQWDIQIYQFAKQLVADRVAVLGQDFQKYLTNVTQFQAGDIDLKYKWNEEQISPGAQAPNLFKQKDPQ